MKNISVYSYYPIIILALGTRNLKSALLTMLLTSLLFFTTFLFKKLLSWENLFFVRFFIFTLQIVLINYALDYFSFEWYLENKVLSIMLFSIYVLVERLKIYGKLAKITYMFKVAIMIFIMGVMREILSFGEVLNFELIKNYEGLLVFNYTAGGLFLATMLLACVDFFMKKEVKRNA